MLLLSAAEGILSHEVDGKIDSLMIPHYFGSKVSGHDQPLTLQTIQKLIERYPGLHRIHPRTEAFVEASKAITPQRLHSRSSDGPAILDRLVLRKSTYVAVARNGGKIKHINTRIEFYGQIGKENIPLSLLNPVDIFWTPIVLMNASILVRTVDDSAYADAGFIDGDAHELVNEANEPQIRLLELLHVIVEELHLHTMMY